MASLQVRQFGPITDSTKIELTSLVLLLGRQSTGKSSYMKVLSFCCWLEKRIMISSEDVVSQYTHNNRFVRELKQFHRLNDDYFRAETSIIYEGDAVVINYSGVNGNPKITRKKDFSKLRHNRKLCYIPSERNLVSAIQNVDRSYKATDRDVLFNFIYEWNEAKSPYTSEHPFRLSVTGDFSYVNKSGMDVVRRADGTETPSFYASSGVQSVMPLDVMTDYITGRVGQNAPLSIIERNLMEDMPADSVRRMTEYQSASLFIEEPEQNLFPESQRLVLLRIVASLNKALKSGSEGSSVFITSHSPYVLSVINVLMLAAGISEAGKNCGDIISEAYILPSSSISGYFIGEDGVFRSVLERDIPMLSGNDLDGVSDWVDEKINALNSLGC